MTCLTCARDGVPMDTRDPKVCMACAIKRRLRPLGPFPMMMPEETETAMNRLQIGDVGGRHLKLRCVQCGVDWWYTSPGNRQKPSRCPKCTKRHRQDQTNASKRRMRQARRAVA